MSRFLSPFFSSFTTVPRQPGPESRAMGSLGTPRAARNSIGATGASQGWLIREHRVWEDGSSLHRLLGKGKGNSDGFPEGRHRGGDRMVSQHPMPRS